VLDARSRAVRQQRHARGLMNHASSGTNGATFMTRVGRESFRHISIARIRELPHDAPHQGGVSMVAPVVWVVTAVLAGSPSSEGRSDGGPAVRAGSERVRALLERTLLDSPTARALAADLAATDVIVYVELTSSPRIARAATMFVVGTPERRFLRIAISASLSPWEHGPMLAHELRHALEIARAPEVRDRDALRDLYQRIGRVEADSRFESAAALDTERAVRAELYGSQRARAASLRP
jgi:hypothetical protein